MTQEMMHLDGKGGIYFDCRNHAENQDVCIIASTLCNILIVACRDCGLYPKEEEDGHLSFDIDTAPNTLIQTFKWVQKVFDELAIQFPSYLMVY